MVWRVLCYGWFASELLILIVTRTRRGDGKISDRGSLLLLWGAITAAIVFSGWPITFMPQAFFGSAVWSRPLSLSIFLAGLAIRWTAILSLGRSFSVNVAIHDDQRVLKTGLFRFVRHPSYLGLMMALFAMGIRTRNWCSLAILIVLPMAALVYRIGVEEAALTDAFGEEYRAYARATKRLLPLIY